MISCCEGIHHHRDFACESPQVLVSSVPFNGQTHVSPNLKAVQLVLRRDFSAEADLERFTVGTDITMWRGSLPGSIVPIAITVSERRRQCGFQHVVFVKPVHPLRGGTVYRVRIKSTFVDRNGVVSVKTSLIHFTTGCR